MIFPSSRSATDKWPPFQMVCFEAFAPAKLSCNRKREHCYLDEGASWVPHCEKRPLVDDVAYYSVRRVFPVMVNHWKYLFLFLSGDCNEDIAVLISGDRKTLLVKFVPNDFYINKEFSDLMHPRKSLVRDIWCDCHSTEVYLILVDCGRSHVEARLCCWNVDHCKINIIFLNLL